MDFKIYYNALTKNVSMKVATAPAPEGYQQISTFCHEPDCAELLGGIKSHVLFHHVQAALDSIGVTDMSYHTMAITYPSVTEESESGGGPIVCAFPFNATLEELQLVDDGWVFPTFSDSNQTVAITLAEVSPGDTKAAGVAGIAPPGATGIDFSTGVKVFGVRFNLPVLVDEASNSAAGFAVFTLAADALDPTSSSTTGITITTELLRDATIGLDVRTSYGLGKNTLIAGGEYTFIIEVDTIAETYRVWQNGVLIDLDNNNFPSGTYTPFIFMSDYGSIAGNEGKTVSVSWLTSAADLDGIAFAHGATDICGNEIPYIVT